MDAPAVAHQFDLPTPRGFAELSQVRLVRPAPTDEGIMVAAGTHGTVVGIWPDHAAYEVDFAAGLATVEASLLVAAA